MNDHLSTIKDCFIKILSHNREESRLAARKIRNLLYRSSTNYDGKYQEIQDVIENAQKNYHLILEDWRQENFVVAISIIYYLHSREDNPDFLFPWLFELLQHSNGNIRYAAVKMISHEFGALTYHIRFPHMTSSYTRLSSTQADDILHSLFKNLHLLADNYYKPNYKRYKYINSLPACPYKSICMLLAELEECCHH